MAEDLKKLASKGLCNYNLVKFYSLYLVQKG